MWWWHCGITVHFDKYNVKTMIDDIVVNEIFIHIGYKIYDLILSFFFQMTNVQAYIYISYACNMICTIFNYLTQNVHIIMFSFLLFRSSTGPNWQSTLACTSVGCIFVPAKWGGDLVVSYNTVVPSMSCLRS